MSLICMWWRRPLSPHDSGEEERAYSGTVELKMKLIIFDMDQTLVDFISVHDEATQELFNRFFDIGARLTEIDFAGRSLVENFLELAKLKGIPEADVDKNSQALLESYERIFGEKLVKQASDHVLPGVRRLLEELSKTDNFVVLYTGDSAGIVDRVLKATGLGKYFRFAVYGTEAPTRVGMVRLAVGRAESITGKKFSDKDVVIIGDSLRDVNSGKQLGAVTIAVATGFHSEEKLLASKPDYLFKSLKSYRKVLQAIAESGQELK
jgi:phosphoglycolate phosphatase-like HAD superfamily hydrolase